MGPEFSRTDHESQKIFSGGKTRENSLLDNPSFEVEAFGVLRGASLVGVEFHFDQSGRDDAHPIGSFVFNTLAPFGGSTSIPQLDVYFNDRDGRISDV
jgi:hypothetical protein